MSAWVVSRKHIIYMVESYNRLNKDCPLPSERLAETANVLWQENIKSVQHRYPDCVNNPENMPGPIGETFVILPKEIKPSSAKMFLPELVQLAKSLACYEYQSCEHDGWNGSDAYTFIRGLEHDILRALPGWDAAHWGGPAGE